MPSESKSRVGYITSKEWLACQGAPSWNSYANDEKFWQLMTTLETIAKKHGTFSCSYFWTLVPARGILDFVFYRICAKSILNLKTPMFAYTAGQEVYFCPESTPICLMRAAKSQTSLRICTDSPELSLPDNKISTQVSYTDAFDILTGHISKIYLFVYENDLLPS